MKEGSSASSGGNGICGLLGVVFVTLKLCGVINWSWWWVTLPFWGPIALVLVVCGCCLLIAIAMKVLEPIVFRNQTSVSKRRRL